jgi:hypothetical protein
MDSIRSQNYSCQMHDARVNEGHTGVVMHLVATP